MIMVYLLLELVVVEGIIGIEDGELVILSAVLVEQQLREEGEVLGIPDVLCVACTERDPALSMSWVEYMKERKPPTCKPCIQSIARVVWTTV